MTGTTHNTDGRRGNDGDAYDIEILYKYFGSEADVLAAAKRAGLPSNITIELIDVHPFGGNSYHLTYTTKNALMAPIVKFTDELGLRYYSDLMGQMEKVSNYEHHFRMSISNIQESVFLVQMFVKERAVKRVPKKAIIEESADVEDDNKPLTDEVFEDGIDPDPDGLSTAEIVNEEEADKLIFAAEPTKEAAVMESLLYRHEQFERMNPANDIIEVVCPDCGTYVQLTRDENWYALWANTCQCGKIIVADDDNYDSLTFSNRLSNSAIFARGTIIKFKTGSLAIVAQYYNAISKRWIVNYSLWNPDIQRSVQVKKRVSIRHKVSDRTFDDLIQQISSSSIAQRR